MNKEGRSFLPRNVQRLLGLATIVFALSPTAAIAETTTEIQSEACTATLSITTVNDINGDGNLQLEDESIPGRLQVVSQDSGRSWIFADEAKVQVPPEKLELSQELAPGWVMSGLIFFSHTPPFQGPQEITPPSAPDTTTDWQWIVGFQAKCNQIIRAYVLNHNAAPTEDDDTEEPEAPINSTTWLPTVMR